MTGIQYVIRHRIGRSPGIASGTGSSINQWFAEMKARRRFWVPVAAMLAGYLLLPMVVFDFSSAAVPFDEENHNGREVAIGPRPWSWAPWAAHDFHWPGGSGYAPNGWPFVVWKPLCLGYLRFRGYEPPAAWR